MNGRFRKHYWYMAALLTILLLALAAPQAYAASKSLLSNEAPKPTPADQEFAAGADRKPTPRTLYATAILLRNQGRDAECEAALVNIIRQHANFTPAYAQLAELRVKQRRVNEARTALEAGLKAQPNDAVLLNNLGMCWMFEENYAKALDAFTRATAAVPRNARYRSNMAAALGMLGRFEEALALYRQALTPTQAEHNIGVLMRARRAAGMANTAAFTSPERKRGGPLPVSAAAPVDSATTTRPALAANAAVALSHAPQMLPAP